MSIRRAGQASAAALLLLASHATAGELWTPAGSDDPLFRLDWQVNLSAGANVTDGEASYDMGVAPSVRLTQETLRGGYDVGAEAEIFYDPEDGEARVGSADIDAGGTYALDESTVVAGRASLTLSQDDPDAPGEDSNVVRSPLVVAGNAEASVTRQVGLFEAGLRGSLGRVVNGETTYEGGSSLDNSFDNVTSYGGGTRLAYGVAPGLQVFADLDVMTERYDEASPSLGAKLDNATYEGRTGLNFKLADTLELEGSLGLGYRDFEDGALPDFMATLYDAKVTYRPDETLSLTGTFATTLSAPGTTAGSRAKLEYAAEGELAYQLNPWLRLRASAGWSEAHHVGIDTEEYGWNVGAGADYLINLNTDLVADYRFSRSTTTPEPAEDQHRVSVGVTFHR